MNTQLVEVSCGYSVAGVAGRVRVSVREPFLSIALLELVERYRLVLALTRGWGLRLDVLDPRVPNGAEEDDRDRRSTSSTMEEC